MTSKAEAMKLRRRYYRVLRRLLGILSLILLPFLVMDWFRLGSDVVDQSNIRTYKFLQIFGNTKYSRQSHPADPKEACPIPHLQNEDRESNQLPPLPGTLCKRLEPVPGSCTIASRLFLSQPSLDCSHQTPLQICVIKNLGVLRHAVKCNAKSCGEAGFQLGLTNSSTGSTTWKGFSSSQMLERRISDLANGINIVKTFGFLLLRCTSAASQESDKKITYDDVWNADYIEPDPESVQILWIPEYEGVRGKHSVNNKGNQEPVSINIIWIDSVSRHHFFRSLPRTVAMIENVNSESRSRARVLDFELFQSMKARTFENMQALLAGEIDLTATPFGMHDMPSEPLHLENSLQRLRSAGYRTLWLEDLCWHWEWGLPKDLLSFAKEEPKDVLWETYLKALNKAGIDDVGPTVASCRILDYYGKNDPFHGPDSLCYNGRHQHDYLLGYLRTQQELYRYHSRPLFSIFVSSISHDASGRRLQTVDTALARYVLFAARQPNTVTFILSDHGNSYGSFMEESAEAQVELYQPILFIIAPETVLKRMEESQRQALVSNQNRLVSMFDLHMTLKALTGIKVNTANNFVNSPASRQFDVLEHGLLQPISANRTCSSLPLLRPNFCICQGYEQPVVNDTYYAVFADFALGQLNNEIQRQFKTANPSAKSGFGRCARLVALWFENVHITYLNKESFTVKLDLHIPNSDATSMEVFLVVVQSGGTSLHQTSLLSFERISTYGIYRQCADESVDVKLCVCSVLSSRNTELPPLSLKSLQQPVLYTETAVRRIDSEEQTACLYLLTRELLTGISFEVANLCPHEVFTLTIDLMTSNTVSSVTTWPVSVVLAGGEIRFLCSEVRASPRQKWNWKYTLQYRHS